MANIAIKYTLKRIEWEETNDPIYPYSATVGGDSWRIRINDFPDEKMYTLLVNEQEIGDFDCWPIFWKRSK